MTRMHHLQVTECECGSTYRITLPRCPRCKEPNPNTIKAQSKPNSPKRTNGAESVKDQTRMTYSDTHGTVEKFFESTLKFADELDK